MSAIKDKAVRDRIKMHKQAAAALVELWQEDGVGVSLLDLLDYLAIQGIILTRPTSEDVLLGVTVPSLAHMEIATGVTV